VKFGVAPPPARIADAQGPAGFTHDPPAVLISDDQSVEHGGAVAGLRVVGKQPVLRKHSSGCRRPVERDFETVLTTAGGQTAGSQFNILSVVSSNPNRNPCLIRRL